MYMVLGCKNGLLILVNILMPVMHVFLHDNRYKTLINVETNCYVCSSI